MSILGMAKSLCRIMRKEFLQMHAYDYPCTNGGWRKYKNNPILGNEDNVLFDPVVRHCEDRYFMCVSNRTNNCIEFYTSIDGIDWIDAKLKYTGNNKKWCGAVNRACFIKKDDAIYLWYTGQANGNSVIGLSIAKNNSSFLDVGENPVLSPTLSFEKNAVMNPCVLWDEEKKIFRMWYAAGDFYEPDAICYAESTDGIEWTKNKEPLICANHQLKYKKKKVGACEVIKYHDYYLMAYIAYQNVHVSRIALAYSIDGFEWKDVAANPIIGPEKGDWDAHAVYKPTLCYNSESDELMLWYNGRKGKKEAIGLAYKYGAISYE